MKTRLIVLFALCSAWICAQELPITKVVLFTSGVGYFEHRGAVSGDALVPLTFTEDQVNDALKSLILRDAAGTVGVVGYPSQDPLDRSLKSFALDLGGPGGLEALLPQLRGVALTLNTPAELTGRLVGLDRRTTTEKTETWLTLATDDGLRVVPLGSVTGLKILDPKVDRELSLALALVAGSRDARKKTVTANFKGTGTRQVSVGYIAEAPVWKTSYRLDLSGTKPFLQAWAIVENTGEVDWNQVRLSLVSGRPVSFVQDLYTPLYVQRPVYEPETEAGPAPRVNQAGSRPTTSPSPAPAMAPMAMSRGAPSFEMDEMSEPEPRLKNSGVTAAATGGTAGELFQFTLQAPVNLARHQSALIPLAASDIEAKKVSLYNPSVDKLHPQNAVWITNSTGLRLPAGPVTVYDGGTYAGDALTDSLIEKDRRLWTYASDLAVRADVRDSGDQTTTKITISRGVLNYRRDLSWTTTYSFVNAAADSRSLLIEHPYRGERTLVSPKTPAETTPQWLRFSVEAPAAGKAELVVKETRTVVETQGLAGWRSEQILAVIQSGPMSAEVKAGLQKLAELKSAADRAALAVSDVEKRKAEQESGQARTRENLAAVGRDSAQGQTYLKRLLDSEALIDQLVTDLAAARKTQATAQKALDDGIKALSAE